MLRAVFMGSDSFSTPILERLQVEGPRLDPPVEVVQVVTQPDRPAGRGRRLQESPVKQIARAYGLSVFQPDSIRMPHALDQVVAAAPDVIVVASFGQFLPRRLLELPRHRCLNLHPSLLPKGRGPSPIESAILGGSDMTGTSLMVMTPRMDAGPIVDQRQTFIGEHENAGELASRLAALSADLLLADLPGWVRGELIPAPQDEVAATYTPLIKKEDGDIDWRQGAQDIARRIRAFTPWPSAYSCWDGRRIRLLDGSARAGSGSPGHVLRLEGGALTIGTGDGVLLVRTVQLAGGRPVGAADLVRGHPGLIGATLIGER